jgi:hypothetical protein
MPAAGPGAGWFPFSIGLEHLSCTGLATGAFSPAGELVLDLGLQGWYRLHIAQNPALRVWLDGEPGYWEMPGDERVVRDSPASFGFSIFGPNRAGGRSLPGETW